MSVVMITGQGIVDDDVFEPDADLEAFCDECQEEADITINFEMMADFHICQDCLEDKLREMITAGE